MPPEETDDDNSSEQIKNKKHKVFHDAMTEDDEDDNPLEHHKRDEENDNNADSDEDVLEQQDFEVTRKGTTVINMEGKSKSQPLKSSNTTGEDHSYDDFYVIKKQIVSTSKPGSRIKLVKKAKKILVSL